MICPVCDSGNQLTRPGTVAVGVFCQGCGARLEAPPVVEETPLTQENTKLKERIAELEHALNRARFLPAEPHPGARTETPAEPVVTTK